MPNPGEFLPPQESVGEFIVNYYVENRYGEAKEYYFRSNLKHLAEAESGQFPTLTRSQEDPDAGFVGTTEPLQVTLSRGPEPVGAEQAAVRFWLHVDATSEFRQGDVLVVAGTQDDILPDIYNCTVTGIIPAE